MNRPDELKHLTDAQYAEVCDFAEMIEGSCMVGDVTLQDGTEVSAGDIEAVAAMEFDINRCSVCEWLCEPGELETKNDELVCSQCNNEEEEE